MVIIGEERNPKWVDKPYVVHCFGPKYNVWKKLASTCHSHFESSLFVVNNRLCGMGVRRGPAPVEGLNEGTKTL